MPGRITLLAAVVWLSPGVALAYIDPGTGSYIYQTLLAAVFTAAFLFRTFWGRVIRLFRRGRPEDKTERAGPE